MGDKSLQDTHLFGLIEAKTVKQRRKRSSERGDYRKASYVYTIRKDGARVDICAKAFCAIFGIGKTRFEKLRRPQLTMTPEDKRGKHNQQRKIGKETRKKVIEHIAKFHVVQSHYSREQNPKRKYLPENLSVRRMWLMYLAENEPEQVELIKAKQKCTAEVKLHIYHEVLNKLNLKFGLPRSDTCAKCDKIEIGIQEAKKTDNKTKMKELEQERQQHHRKAENAYAKLNTLSAEATTSTNLDTYTFDFQQNLPVPTVKTSDMFYSRMMWVYNFGVHDASTGDGIMHLWDETVAKRGSSEVCSCLQSTILSRHTNAKRLVVFSDSCCGQNKNKAILDMWAGMAQGNPYDQVDHMYLIKGHTYLPNDRDFAQIEKYKKKCEVVLPHNYDNVIKEARTTKKN